MASVPADLSKLCNVVKNDVIKTNKQDKWIKKVNANDTSGLVKKQIMIPSITGLAITAVLNITLK